MNVKNSHSTDESLPVIFIVSDLFPFEKKDPFIRNEMEVLCSRFKCNEANVILSEKGNNHRISDERDKVYVYYSVNFLSKVRIFRFLFQRFFWHEIFFMLRKRNIIKVAALREILHILFHADEIARQFKRKYFEEWRTTYSPIYYSFWTDEKTVAGILLKRQIPQLKVITRAHGWDVYFQRHHSNYLPFRKLLAEELDFYFFISKNGLNYTLEQIGLLNSKNMVVSHLGIRKILDKAPESRPSVFKVYTCSNLIPIKRINLMIEALSLIPDIDIIWHHYGAGFLEEELKLQASKQLKDKSNIHFEFKGYIDNQKIIPIILSEKYSFLINLSASEGIPVTMMEAMAMGIPVIGTNVGAVGEIIRYENNGYLLPSDPSSMQVARAIKKMYVLSEIQYAVLSKNAYKTWNEDFNAKLNYNDFADQITELM